MELYKFCERKWHDAFFTDGSLRLSPLSSYTRPSAGSMVNDSREGRVSLQDALIEDVTVEKLLDYPFLSRGLTEDQIAMMQEARRADKITKGGTISIKGATHVSVDLYLFCTSHTFTDELFQSWRQEENYDACYRINSSRLFFRAVTRAISDHSSFQGWVKVLYFDTKAGLSMRDPISTLPPVLFKDTKNFGVQSEVRAIWAPNTRDPNKKFLEYLDIKVPDAIKYCTPYR